MNCPFIQTPEKCKLCEFTHNCPGSPFDKQKLKNILIDAIVLASLGLIALYALFAYYE